MKKFLSFALCLMMIFTISIPASAASSNKTRSITDPSQIAYYAETMGLEENPEDIVEIIISDSCVEEDVPVPLRSDPIGPEEYIFTLLEHDDDKQGELIRSTDYQAPGGEMTVSETMEITFHADAEISAEIISVNTGISVGRSVTVSDTQRVDVPVGQTRTCNAYVKIDYYEYNVVCDDVFIDDDLGTLTISKPVGVIFVITRK